MSDCYCAALPQICVVKERNPTEMRDLPSRYVEISMIHYYNMNGNLITSLNNDLNVF